MQYGKVEQTLGERRGLEANFMEQKMPACVQLRLEEFHRRSVNQPLWQFVPVRNYPNAEVRLATSDVTLNVASMTTKPRTGWAAKPVCVTLCIQ